ncbi:hypothetical protein Plec18167_002363 [Paecilomyces lecythidis]|uniref:Ketopantoate reductase N-terminal domain-containing protein n=1 Tax=Paecilomyces lecythidis TaxID=3004212 RepID=A0ABR3Y9Z2_9EURO
MSETQPSRILIVGAGSMGVIVGYFLTQANAQVTFLIRPHHIKDLDRPQTLYCYDDNSLKHFEGYKFITDPSHMGDEHYDYVVITLDASSLQNSVGKALVESIGATFRDSSSKVVLGSVAIGIRKWFLEVSGLKPEQVATGLISIHAYPTDRAVLEVHAPTNPALIAQADLAFTDRMGAGFILLDTALDVANGFAELYNQCRVSTAAVVPELDTTTKVDSLLAVMAACELVNWPSFSDLSQYEELWSITTAAVKEICALAIHGEPGRRAAESTTEKSLASSMKEWQKNMLSFDLQGFNRFHHGAKVNRQDRLHLRTCISLGEAEGKPMSALKELLERVEAHEQS